MLRRCGVVALGLSWATPCIAAEPASTFHLSWVRGPGAEDCPGFQEIARGVSERLGRDPWNDRANDAIEASATRSDATWRVQIRVRKASGELIGSRDLDTEAADCRAIADTVSLAIALAIDPDAALGPKPPPPVAEPPPLTPTPPPTPLEPTPIGCPPAAPCPEPAQATPEASVSFAGRALAAGGKVPGLAFGAGVAGDVGSLGWHLTGGFSWLPETTTDDGRFRFGLSAATLGGCRSVIREGFLAFELCGEAEFGAIHSVVLFLEPRPAVGEELWLSFGLGPRLIFSLPGPFFAELGGIVSAPVTRPRFRVRDEPETVFQSSAVAGTAHLGLGISSE